MSFYKTLEKIRYDFENGETPQAIVDVFDRHIDDLLAMNLEESIPATGSTISIEDQTAFSDSGEQTVSSYFKQRFLVATWFRGNW